MSWRAARVIGATVMVLVLGVACEHVTDGAPGPTAVFVMRLEPSRCDGNLVRTCFDATITNVGSARGSGYCEIHGFSDATGDVYIVGPRVNTTLGPRQTIHKTLVWSKVPQRSYSGYCIPGPTA